MTDLGSSRPSVETSGAARGSHREATAWAGWVAFAGFMLIMLGFFPSLEGLVAIFDDGYYRVTSGRPLVEADYTAWGWTHLLLGALILVSGAGVCPATWQRGRWRSSSPGSAHW